MLAERIDPCSGLLEELLVRGVLSRRDWERVKKTRGGEIEKNIQLLALIERKSQNDFDQFVEALRETNQQHIANELACHVNGRIYVKTNGYCSVETIEMIEKDVIDCINKESQVEGYHIQASFGSIKVRFTCLGFEDVDKLQQMYASRELDSVFTKKYVPGLTDPDQIKCLQVFISEDEFNRRRMELKSECHKLMTHAHVRALNEAATVCADDIELTDRLLKKLDLLAGQLAAIESGSTNNERVTTMLSIVSRRPDWAFDRLVESLRETDQEDTADRIIKLASDDFADFRLEHARTYCNSQILNRPLDEQQRDEYAMLSSQIDESAEENTYQTGMRKTFEFVSVNQ
jgi:Caspase recruitment domain